MAFTALVFCELFKSFSFRNESKPLWRLSLLSNLQLPMVAADIQKLGCRGDVEISAVKSFERMQEELRGESLGKLVIFFRWLSEPTSAARHFVSLCYAPAFSMHGPGGGASF